MGTQRVTEGHRRGRGWSGWCLRTQRSCNSQPVLQTLIHLPQAPSTCTGPSGPLRDPAPRQQQRLPPSSILPSAEVTFSEKLREDISVAAKQHPFYSRQNSFPVSPKLYTKKRSPHRRI